MPNVTRGRSMGGLMVYLASTDPERTDNVHTDPHLVAGSAGVMAWHSDAELDHAAALALARELDHPRRAYKVDVPGGDVWHCSLSLAADEGQLTDEQWAALAEDFVRGMGFDGDVDPETGAGRAPCRWAAVRHGLSRAGNDHVHLAVSLVREDGTRANVWRDLPRAQALAAGLERRHGLRVLESRAAGRGSRAPSRGELAAAERNGWREPARALLERRVRGTAAASATEAEFVRGLRAGRILVRPRFAAGTQDVVIGYSVADRPAKGARPVWFGGGALARDLTLPRLRADWPDRPDTATEAVAEWQAAWRGKRPANPGRRMHTPTIDPALWDTYLAEIGRLREQLREVSPDDQSTWAQVAGRVSGVFAAWSGAVEGDRPGPLAAAAGSLAASAQVRAHVVVGRPRIPALRGAALLASSLAHGGSGGVATAVLLRQLSNTVRAVHDMHAARGEAARAADLAATVRWQLAQVRDTLPALPSPAPAPARPGPAAGPATLARPIPGRATPTRSEELSR